ncbi:MAG: hypothetical protein IPI36_01535 [Chitinophagaceae bacterium]|nr:hypothetical protein [Chitinophagaceae bacterium]
MKNISTLLNIVLLLALGFLYYKVYNDKNLQENWLLRYFSTSSIICN